MKKQSFILRPGDDRRRRNAMDAIRLLPLDDSWMVRIEPYKRNRTLSQNSLLWLWHTERAGHFGETKEHEHREFKRRHVLPILLRDDDDGHLTKMHGLIEYADPKIRDTFADLLSTTMLSTKQFTEALNEYEMVTAQQGLVLSRPEDVYHEAMASRMPVRRTA